MVGSLEGEAAFDRAEHPFMVKTHSKRGREGNFLNLVKDIKKAIAKLILRNSSFVTKIIYMARMCLLTTGFQHPGSPC